MLRSTKLGFPVIQPRLNLFPPVVQPRLNFTAVTWELQRRLNLFECTNGGCSGRVDGGVYIYLYGSRQMVPECWMRDESKGDLKCCEDVGMSDHVDPGIFSCKYVVPSVVRPGTVCTHR